MEDIESWSARHPIWQKFSKYLADKQLKLNGQSKDTIEEFVQKQPEEDRPEWRALFADFAADQAVSTSSGKNGRIS